MVGTRGRKRRSRRETHFGVSQGDVPFQHRYVTEPPDKLKKLVKEEVLSHELQEFVKLTPKRKLLQTEVDRLVRRHMAGQDEIKDAQKKQKV